MHVARPNFYARHCAITAGHYLAAAAGYDVLREGGNAIDAAATAAFCLAVLEPHQNGLGGECPAIVHFGGKTYAVSGQGFSPAGLTIDWFRERSIILIPGDGLLPATVPAFVGTWLMLCSKFGTMPLPRILEPAISIAEEGFAVYDSLHNAIEENRQRFITHWPTSADVYLVDGETPAIGTWMKFPALAQTLRLLRNEAACRPGREDGIQGAMHWFYRGVGAAAMESFCATTSVPDATETANTGFLTRSDLSKWKPALEAPVTFDYKGVTVCKCGPWSQGPVFLQQLAILAGVNLHTLGYGTVQYWHTIVEAARLAFADREAYYGDPAFDEVPLDRLLSAPYSNQRRQMIDPARAAAALRPGDVLGGPKIPDVATAVPAEYMQAVARGRTDKDTTHLDVVDKKGNCISATPSGGWLSGSPVMPDLGFALGTRGQMFYLDPSRPNALAPRKRPRTTLTPSMAFKDGKPWLVFGTPGGDAQDQWTLQAFLNIVEFGMKPFEAVEAPTVTVLDFPSSFYPRNAYPKTVGCERRIRPEILEGLRARGHVVKQELSYSHGKPSVIQLLDDGGYIAAISSRAEVGYAMGW